MRMKPKIKAISPETFKEIRKILDTHKLHTVCEEALCPNISECWSARTATFLLMGDVCTRNCRFCSVKTGDPQGFLDKNEPQNIAKAVKEMGLEYVVLTSVTRDDLPDGGAGHFAETVKKIKNARVEVLIPDNIDLNVLLDAKPDVIAHNIETVRELTPIIRDKRTNYDLSLKILRQIKEINPDILTKSSLLLGFGETEARVKASLNDLKAHNVDIVVIGQYLRPSQNQVQVIEYISDENFKKYEDYCRQIGIESVISRPLARSSYKAHIMNKERRTLCSTKSLF